MRGIRLAAGGAILAIVMAACSSAATPAPASPAASTVPASIAPSAVPSTAPSAAPSSAPEAVTVRFGQLPYLDYAPWAVADAKGYLKDEGLTFEYSTFEVEQPMFEAMVGGSIDVGDSADTPFILSAAKAPELRLLSMASIFTGYSIMARPGAFKTYEEILPTVGNDRAKALAEVCGQLKGKTVILPGGASFTPILDTCLGYAGLTRDDVKTIDIDPVEGAAAFIRGEGDFYSDGLPQRFRLEKEGMVNVVTGNQLAGGAMDVAGIATTQKFLDEHPGIAERLMRAWYRSVDYIAANPDDGLKIMTDWVNGLSGAGLTVDDGKRFLADLLKLPTYAESGPTFYDDPTSPFYYLTRLNFVVDYFGKAEGLDTGAIDLTTLVPAPQIFPNAKP